MLSTMSLADKTLVELDARPGAKIKFMLIEPEGSPRAVLLSYPGGRGTIDLRSFLGIPSINKYKENFLVRTRKDFVEAGFVVALPDVPSDREWLRYKYRLSETQTADARAIVDYLGEKYSLPVWIMGTSASSLTAAYVAVHMPEAFQGVVLTASVTRVKPEWAVYDDFPQGTASVELAKISVPVVIASNREDGCNLSPSEDTELIRERLTNSPRVEVKYYSGGDTPRSKPCNALSRHGFLGLENQVVGDLVTFIRQNTP